MLCVEACVRMCDCIAEAGVAVAAIDLGNEWMKISLVKVRVPSTVVTRALVRFAGRRCDTAQSPFPGPHLPIRHLSCSQVSRWKSS